MSILPDQFYNIVNYLPWIELYWKSTINDCKPLKESDSELYVAILPLIHHLPVFLLFIHVLEKIKKEPEMCYKGKIQETKKQ